MGVSLKGCELVDQTFAQRRQRLELLLPDLHPCPELVEQTASIELARDRCQPGAGRHPRPRGLSEARPLRSPSLGEFQKRSVPPITNRPILRWSGRIA